LSEKVAEITHQNGVNAVIDCVGGAIAGDLIRSLAIEGQFVIYGGFSPDKFQVHNFDILMKGAAIKSYVYRYFFNPPSVDDRKLLNEIAGISARPDFNVRVGGVHTLDEFKIAIDETLHHPGSGKQLLRMSEL
jgi:NADPH:quinone reductase-like Zn-dependent oxidoreductase